ncbi:DUF3006 domain-containing protein [Marinococcus halotolerans]|uniref:DUF3006 domain-containing protein n=1 Tax=Marinococcus halotolerans TaxID=301092 RepID=UPI0003B68BBE|nr:DUF3006 domain-containing protein [Marinococcus halotolerans]
MEKYTVDRLEGTLAILLLAGDESVQREIDREQMPNGLKEGDVVEIEWNSNGSIHSVMLKTEETEIKKEKARSLLHKLKNKR